ncbi:MAG: prepilin-type N-terminal cleavage/methylation domain-containing protein [Betaproteobacteria bacterium]|nr:prepilin-type N-terminal cleavage/methylation domain-containing protein [Betaproteobacteria bacterium]MBI2293572.1 prepilin-type N-terminal cleavage/methylation domain-containing protein [Betaproteobacteria bacterium]
MRKQTGFTLIEIAIVLVIIGLLLGGVLKGQELIQSARVRNLASMQDGVKAAFFGFQDRFRALPGDYTLGTTNITGATANGNGNGQIETTGTCGTIPGCQAYEHIITWEHLSRAGFINGTYTAAATDAAATTPLNAYNMYLRFVYDTVYGVATPAARHNLKTGPGIPVAVIAELDRKVDDGLPGTGSFQYSTWISNAATAPETPAANTAAPHCVSTAVATTAVWNATNGTTNCGGATLL